MARGDCHFFRDWIRNNAGGSPNNLASDTLRLGICKNGITPTVDTADPRWGASGTTNFYGVAGANECLNHVGGYNGPITMTGATWVASAGGVIKLSLPNVTIPLDASGFSDGYWGILYDDTDTGKHCVGFVELTGPVSIQAGALNINWANGIFGQVTAA